MQRILRLGLVVVIMAITMFGVATAPTASAVTLKVADCAAFAKIGPFVTNGVSGIGWSFKEGETIIVTAKNAQIPVAPEAAPSLGGSSIILEVNGAVVDSAINNPPVTLMYTFPADGVYSWRFYVNFDEGVMHWTTDCLPAPVAGCDLRLYMPDWAVVGAFTTATVLEWTPGETTDTTVEGGKTAWVLGVNEDGTHYLIYWGCSRLWVPMKSMGPNYDDVWNGTPLPTVVMD